MYEFSHSVCFGRRELCPWTFVMLPSKDEDVWKWRCFNVMNILDSYVQIPFFMTVFERHTFDIYLKA